ncbi:MAG TPA: DNA topoisomerase 4 subunit A [Brevefilum sp.]|nr:DNA topoisomerase 4 subunit A [Brevefilum sp.]
MDLGTVRSININEEMQQSYLDYAMSVIVSRALPDARDGLKPVQRRILYAMFEMGLRSGSAHKKSARIVGEVLGKYHPHGDMAVYDAMARLAQDFSQRYRLVEGQGNFGSIDGDPPAAMRYTEARLTEISMDILQQLGMDTVDFLDNFDGTLQEPEVLPSSIPNLLVNGASGIAVAMATNIPPHNLGEVVDALVMMFENWTKIDDIGVEDLMKYIKGPDFPTGGLIITDDRTETLAQAYGSGKGRVRMRARVLLEEMSRGRKRIIVTELPYMTNKATLIEKIAEFVRDGSLEGVSDLRDESDRLGMRIVIELSKSANPDEVLKTLYKRTAMQGTFGINILALVKGQPQNLNLKQALKVFADHRLEVVRRRSEYELKKSEERIHILNAYLIALENLDEVIDTIRRSHRVETARNNLMRKFNLDEIQAQAILDMPLRRLAALERKKIEDEHKEVEKRIKELKALLRSPKMMREVVINELKEVRTRYADARRTQIIQMQEGETAIDRLTTRDMMPEKCVWVAVSKSNKIARTDGDKSFRQWGLGAPGMVLRTTTHHTLYLVTETGEAAALAVQSLPVADDPDSGISVTALSPLSSKHELKLIFSAPSDLEEGDGYVVSVSKMGMVKRSALSELPGPSAHLFTLVKINNGDALKFLLFTKGDQTIFLATKLGMGIRFNEEEARPMGLVAAGVNGLKLRKGDEVVGGGNASLRGEILLVTNRGKAKRMEPSQFPLQGRYGLGVIAWRLPDDEHVAGSMIGILTSNGVVHFKEAASRLLRVTDAPSRTRTQKGEVVIDVKKGDEILEMTVPLDAVSLVGK